MIIRASPYFWVNVEFKRQEEEEALMHEKGVRSVIQKIRWVFSKFCITEALLPHTRYQERQDVFSLKWPILFHLKRFVLLLGELWFCLNNITQSSH